MKALRERTVPIDLKDARILLTNDDGIRAPGLKCLERILRPLVKELFVIAPEIEQSATSHALSLRSPLRIRKISKFKYAVNGTPTDAVLLGITEILKGRCPDVLFSGINRGGNLAEDVTYSGTVGAAIEGTLLGVRSVALSQVYSDNQPIKWSTAENWAPQILKKLFSIDWSDGVLLNVNFPDCDASKVIGVQVCRQARRRVGHMLQRRTDPRDEDYYWIGSQIEGDHTRSGTDLYASKLGAITITPLSIDMTDVTMLKRMKALFGG